LPGIAGEVAHDAMEVFAITKELPDIRKNLQHGRMHDEATSRLPADNIGGIFPGVAGAVPAAKAQALAGNADPCILHRGLQMPITITPVTNDFSVAPQLSPADLGEIAQLGYRAVINNRPDGEGGPGQPAHAQMEEAARAAGLQYVYVPVAPSADDPAAIARMREVLQQLPRPVLAFCRTGTRSTKLFRAAGGAA
jgi:uncharacterized protein (TIGR01244 family)